MGPKSNDLLGFCLWIVIIPNRTRRDHCIHDDEQLSHVRIARERERCFQRCDRSFQQYRDR